MQKRRTSRSRVDLWRQIFLPSVELKTSENKSDHQQRGLGICSVLYFSHMFVCILLTHSRVSGVYMSEL